MVTKYTKDMPKPVDMESPSAYRDWAQTFNTTKRSKSGLREPLLIRLKGEDAETRTEARRWLMLAIETGQLQMEAHDRALLRALVDDTRSQIEQKQITSEGLPNEIYQVYRELSEKIERLEQYADILQIGAPLRQRGSLPMLQMPGKITFASKRPTPIVAVIDDGIGFLNRRFRTAAGDTRVQAIWLQSLNTIPMPGFGGFYVYSGQVLYKPEIDNILSRGAQLDEGAIYRALNDSTVRDGEHRSTEFSYSHGTHILDVAAGAEPGSGAPAENWPILAVQLPPEAVNNTAGTQLEPSLVQGVRWILAQAEGLNPESPVIINISFGTFAGPKNGTKPIEYLIAQDVAAWEARTGRTARVVYAFGNDRENRQAAYVDLEASGKEAALTWRIPPDNAASSLVELHAEPFTRLSDLELSVTAPSGASFVNVQLPPFTVAPLIDASGATLAQVFHVGAIPIGPGVTKPAHYLVAVPPTKSGMPAAMGPRSEHGAWEFRFRQTGTVHMHLRAEVQRGDTPVGYRRFGRQSYFDHPDAYAWDPEEAAYTGLESTCPITTRGTHSSFVTAGTRQTLSVAASEGPDWDQSPYSSEGAPWTFPAPSLSAIGDDAPGRGVLAAGTNSGSVKTGQGTSVAAARLTHALALFMWNTHLAGPVAVTQSQEISSVLAQGGTNAPSAEAFKFGSGHITLPAGSRGPR